MLKHIVASYCGKDLRIAWATFQPDGSISFGLRDKTYISPRSRTVHSVWSAYNRVGVQYAIPSNPAALEPVENPHFTFHPPATFHLKSNKDRASRGEAIFQGVALVDIALQQDGEMPWIRAVSRPLDEIPTGGLPRKNGASPEDIRFEIPIIVTRASISVEIDFVRDDDVSKNQGGTVWAFSWHGIGLRIKVGFITPQTATLSWFHFY